MKGSANSARKGLTPLPDRRTIERAMRGHDGRVNGSKLVGRGAVNGSRMPTDRGATNGRGTAGNVPALGRRKPVPRRRLAAVAAAALILCPLAFALALSQGGAAFSVDGRFGEWAGVTPIGDASAGNELPSGVDLVEVRIHANDRQLFVYARTRGALFGGADESIVRVFVDGDRNRATGFALGELGADFMLEVAGVQGIGPASGLFRFSAVRGQDDWNGWERAGPIPVATSGDQMETLFPGIPEARRAGVLVALSAHDGSQDVQDAPSSAGGALVVTQVTDSEQVVSPDSVGVRALGLVLSTAGPAVEVRSVVLEPSGSADFRTVQQARLLIEGRAAGLAGTVAPDSISFSLDPPLRLGPGQTVRATVELDFSGGDVFAQAFGASFGATVSGALVSPEEALLVRQPRHLPPSAYLGYISPAPVVDGAFGEWRLAQAVPDPTDLDAPAGSDLVGTRAMWRDTSGAFFAEARDNIFEGAAIADLPRRVQDSRQPPPAEGPLTPSAPATAPPELPPLTADDRLLVYIDADNDPRTGFQPYPGAPVGAEFVIQLGGRFAQVDSAHLLEFAGRSAFESAWAPRASIKAISAGHAVEGELPALLSAQGGAARLLFQTLAWSGATGDLSDAVQEVAFTSPKSDNFLHFRSVVFDPLLGAPPVRPGLLATEPNGFWVVQLKATPTTAAISALAAAGATLHGYVHSNAYLASMDVATAETVRAMAEVRWVGIYQPAFKFPTDPAEWGEAPRELMAVLFEAPDDLEAALKAVGAQVISASPMAVRLIMPGRDAERLGAIAEVQFVEPQYRRVPLNDIGRRLSGVNLTFEHLGLNGSGIVVGLSDTGTDFTHPAFDDTGNASSGPQFDGRIVGYYTYGASYGDLNGHGTHTAGSIAGDGDLSNTVNNSTAGGTYQFRGVAPAAALVITPILASSASPPPDDQVFADQEAFGATASSNSWGYVINAQGDPLTDYDIGAYLTDISVIDANTSKPGLQPITIVFAAGNAGPSSNTVGSPGTAKNVITVGASESDRGLTFYADNASQVASFSSRGPTDDSRIRPDVVAVGTFVLSTESRTTSCACDFGSWERSWTGANYEFSGGTSMATPQVSGMVALIQQHFNDTYGRIPSPALVKAALINGAQDLGYGYEFTGGVTGPMSQGWGRVNASRSIEGPPGGTILLFDEGTALASGDVVVRHLVVGNASVPLKVTLVWSDAPGSPLDTKSLSELVNDLDLVVRAPNGTYYHGNKFVGAWSSANENSFDRLNNVENVFVSAPSLGTWTVEVTGYSVKSVVQDFALVISGNVTAQAPVEVADVHGVSGAPAGAKFGWNVTASGSINGDAYTDVVVGAPGTGAGNGSAYIFFGGPSADFSNFNVLLANVTLSGSAGEGFGWSLDTSGDFDGDGVLDLLVGAPNGGKAYLFFGGPSWIDRTANVTFNGSSAEQFGAAVRLVPSLDNGTGAEAVIGAPANNSSKGTVYSFSGGSASGTWNANTANSTLLGDVSGWRLGAALSAGDLDGDGAMDLGVGAPGASVVRIARGGFGPAALAFNATITGVPGTAFGLSLSLEGDLNADGKADMVIGAPLARDSAGTAYVFFGESPIADDRIYRYYFLDDMESDNGKWNEMSAETIGATSWSLATTVYFGDSASGHSWQDGSGSYGNLADRSIAFKDSINLSGATSPVLTFVYRADLEEVASNFDGFLVKYSTNNGSSWTQLDSTNAQRNYDATVDNPNGNPNDESVLAGEWAFTIDRPAWRSVTFNLSALAGASSVKIRFQFASDITVTSDGVYIDDIAVREANPSSPNLTLYGEAPGDLFGWSLSAFPSVGGDAVDDFAVGAPGAQAQYEEGAGSAFLFAGSVELNGSMLAADSDEVMRGTDSGDQLGYSLVGISGFNQSSATYLFVGAPGAGGGAGSAGVGDASAAIPEFGSTAAVALMMVPAVFLLRSRRRTR